MITHKLSKSHQYFKQSEALLQWTMKVVFELCIVNLMFFFKFIKDE